MRAGAYAGEDPERSQRRAQIVDRLSGSSRDRAIRRALTTAASDFLSGNKGALDQAWFGPAFDYHVARGGAGAARALVEQALASEDPVFRPAALDAVAGSGIESVAKWLLYELNDPRLRASERRLGMKSG